MSSDTPGRGERTTANASPVGSTVAIVVAILAVIAGYFIMNNIRNGDSEASPQSTVAASSTVDPSATTTTVATPSTPALTFAGTSVQVVNSARQNGVAGQMSDELTAAGFTMVDPSNGDDELDTTMVLLKDQTDPTASAVAQTVAFTLGVGQVTPFTEEAPPNADGAWPDGVGVMVLLGKDKAGKTIAEITGGAAGGSTTASTGAGTTTATTAAPSTTG
jgi:hypothetical protein